MSISRINNGGVETIIYLNVNDDEVEKNETIENTIELDNIVEKVKEIVSE